MIVIQIVRNRDKISIFLILVFIILTATIDSSAHRTGRRHHHSKTKGSIIGGVVGGVGGALIGGKKGAVIGAGAGAGTGYLVQRHRNKKHRKYRVVRRYR
jgi:osmotically inducible lipoprotein OsmB